MSEIYQREYTNPQTNWGNELCDLVITENNEFFKATYRSHFNLYFLVFLRQLNLDDNNQLDVSKTAKEFYEFLEEAEITHGYQAVYDLFEVNDQMDLFNDSILFIDFEKPQEIQWTINSEKRIIVQNARMILSDLKSFLQNNETRF